MNSLDVVPVVAPGGALNWRFVTDAQMFDGASVADALPRIVADRTKLSGVDAFASMSVSFWFEFNNSTETWLRTPCN